MTTIINDKLIETLESKGFNRWQKNGMDRLYVNAGTLGLVCTYYKTGNIRSAVFGGEEISNSRGRSMKAAKTYIDLVKGMIVSDDAELAHAAAELSGLACEDSRSWDNIIKIA